jgi:SpoVK/Ycf46/Vps4 family AAA+-type ATPase
VVVLDDVDLYTGRRGGHTDDGLGAFLSALDGARRHNDVLSVATTNDPKAMDAAAIPLPILESTPPVTKMNFLCLAMVSAP